MKYFHKSLILLLAAVLLAALMTSLAFSGADDIPGVIIAVSFMHGNVWS